MEKQLNMLLVIATWPRFSAFPLIHSLIRKCDASLSESGSLLIFILKDEMVLGVLAKFSQFLVADAVFNWLKCINNKALK